MLLGIIKQKTKEKIIGECKIKEVIVAYNKTKTIVCENYAAKSFDKIIFNCDKCGKEENIGKRMFFYGNKDKHLLCERCASKQTSLNKYGVKSPNQSATVKIKQHAVHSNRKDYIDGNEHKENKTSSPEELSKLRSENAKQLWAKGTYNNMTEKWSEITKTRLQDPKYKAKWVKSLRTAVSRKNKSEAAKRTWKNPEYRAKMAKNAIRISKFQKNVFESMEEGWLMEYPIPDTPYTVDMYNPKTNKIIECYGDYWHCNPDKFNKDYYHKRVHKTAREIWDRDTERIKLIESLGYDVEIIWEKDWNTK